VSVGKSSTATATTGTADTTGYVGRFAPSPTGDLHLGSLLTAVASFLDARASHGQWLLRIEDLDRDREVAGATGRILHALEAFGFEWDGPVVRQSDREALYEETLESLRLADRVFECSCSRRLLRDEQHYPGTCRRSAPPPGSPTAVRFKVDAGPLKIHDRIQGTLIQNPAISGGDYIVKRRDGIIAYALAVVVDDAAQGITHVVRGADLLESTGAQILLQRALKLPTPVYAHVPVLTEPDGAKLAKSRRSPSLKHADLTAQLCQVSRLLGMKPPAELEAERVRPFWEWAVGAWDLKNIPGISALPMN